jgi:hypothetical protein
MLGRDEWTEIEAQGGLLGLVAIRGETREQMHAEVDRAAVARVLDLADVLPFAGAGAR